MDDQPNIEESHEQYDNKTRTVSPTKNLLLGLLVAVLVGAGIYFLFSRTGTKTVGEQPDSTTDWEVYSNNRYGFELKYPKDWQTLVCMEGQRLFLFASSSVAQSVTCDIPFTGADLSVIGPGSPPGNIQYAERQEAIDINDVEATRYFDVPVGHELFPPSDLRDMVVISGDSGVFTVSLSPHHPVLDNIISTFRFIDPTDTFDWKTYHNKEYGFEFEYHANSIVEEVMNEQSEEILIKVSLPITGPSNVPSVDVLYIQPKMSKDKLSGILLITADDITLSEEFFSDVNNFESYAPNHIRYEGNISVAGRSGIRVLHKEYSTDDYYILKNEDGSYFVIELADNVPFAGTGEFPEYPVEFGELQNKILSTFKFTDDWQTHHDDRYPFQIAFPNSWIASRQDGYGTLIIEDTDESKKDPYYDTYRSILYIDVFQSDSLENWFAENAVVAGYEQGYEETTINGIAGRKWSPVVTYGGCDESIALFDEISSRIFHIRRSGGTCDYTEGLINSVVSSFEIN